MAINIHSNVPHIFALTLNYVWEAGGGVVAGGPKRIFALY